jgi:hypothetical protein
LEHKLLIKILNNRGPKVEPCGNTDNVGKGEEEFFIVRKTENDK